MLGGDNPGFRLFEIFAENLDIGLPAPDLERMSDVPHTTVYRVLEQMEAQGCIALVGRRGRAKVYKLNTDSPLVREHAGAVLRGQAEQLRQATQSEEPVISMAARFVGTGYGAQVRLAQEVKAAGAA